LDPAYKTPPNPMAIETTPKAAANMDTHICGESPKTDIAAAMTSEIVPMASGSRPARTRPKTL
jgi:hypothetical protein